MHGVLNPDLTPWTVCQKVDGSTEGSVGIEKGGVGTISSRGFRTLVAWCLTHFWSWSNRALKVDPGVEVFIRLTVVSRRVYLEHPFTCLRRCDFEQRNRLRHLQKSVSTPYGINPLSASYAMLQSTSCSNSTTQTTRVGGSYLSASPPTHHFEPNPGFGFPCCPCPPSLPSCRGKVQGGVKSREEAQQGGNKHFLHNVYFVGTPRRRQ